MKICSRFQGKYAVIIFGLVSASLILAGIWFSQPRGAEAKIMNGISVPAVDERALDKHHPRVQAAMQIRERHHHGFMAMPHVVGTAVGLTEDQHPAVLVLTKKPTPAGLIPAELEGTPVLELVTGEIVAMPAPSRATRVDPTGWFPRPVPIGVSTGNIGECSAGTIGARVTGGGKVFALSNNHVYALENDAPNGSAVVQPGLYDTKCATNSANVIGHLSTFVPITFTGDNTVDAAIAETTEAYLGNATPSNGYGTPNSTTKIPAIGQAVQKYGRTTGLTKGTIQAINATIKVTYTSGTANFVNQIIITSRKAFIKAGDSGSLLVTNDAAAYPVGLLFAGNSSGTYAIANPIDAVLEAFGVTIDGK